MNTDMQMKMDGAAQVVDHLMRLGHEVLQVKVDVFARKPIIEVAPLPVCENLRSCEVVELLADGSRKHSRQALVGNCRVEWRR